MGILQNFCFHKMKSHAKEQYKYTTKEVVEGTEHWKEPIVQDMEYSNIIEVLICEKCGLIKIIEY